MTRLSQAQVNVMRQRPQNTQLYLSIYQPQVIFTAQINDASIGRGARVITFNNPTGTYTNVENGMTMWIGSTFTGQDIGKIRVRSASSTTITVSENSNINWQNQQYLTVYKYVELWPIFPRIIQDPANALNTIWYKDYDIAYTNQNSVLGTYVNAGPHRAAILDPASNQARIYYSSTGSYNLLGSNLSYFWTFEGGTPSTSNAADPGYVTYNSVGHKVTKLIISGSNGEVDTTYRYVSIYDQAHPPIQKWSMDDLRGSRDEGGYSLPIKVYEIIPLQQNAVVVIFGNNYYGDVLNNLGGNYPNAGDIFFVGYIDKDSIEYDYQHSEISFEAVSITDLMKKSSGFSVSVGSKANPAYWYELLDMDGRRALYHYLRWHTTAMLFNDFQWVGDDYKIQFFDSDRESMYDSINNYMRDTLIGQTVADRQGKVWLEIQAMAYTNPTGTFTPVMNITNRDWKDQPVIEERLNPEVSYAEYGGVAYSGVNTGTFAALIGSAPGSAPGFYGGIDNHSGMALLGQSQLNSLVGNVVANRNSPYPEVHTPMSINTGNLDIAPQEVVGLHILKEDTVRNLAINGIYLPNGMTWKYDPINQILLPEIDFKQLVSGIAGETVTIPTDPTNNIGGGFNVPQFPDIPFPPIGFPSLPSSTTEFLSVIIHDRAISSSVGLLYCTDLSVPTPLWTIINGGLAFAQYSIINRVMVCPNGSVYVCTFGNGDNYFIARADAPGSTFQTIFNKAIADDEFGAGSANSTFVLFMSCRPDLPEEVIFFVGNSNGSAFFHGSAGVYSQVPALVSLGGSGPGRVPTFGNGLWMLGIGDPGGGDLKTWHADYTTINTIDANLGLNQNEHVRAGQSGITVHISSNPTPLRVGLDNFTSSTAITPSPALDYGAYLATFCYRIRVDDSGQYILCRTLGGHPARSIDGGFVFTTIPDLAAYTSEVLYSTLGGDTTASQWVAAANDGLNWAILKSDDGGGSWKNVTGNLLSVAPLINVDTIDAVPIL